MKVIIDLRQQSLSAGDHGFKKGDRVIVRVAKDEWYTGSVIKAGAKLVKVDFDDGQEADIEPEDFKHIKTLLVDKKFKKPLTLAKAKELYTAPKTAPKKVPTVKPATKPTKVKVALKKPASGLSNPLGKGKWRIFLSQKDGKWECEVRDHPTDPDYKEGTPFKFKTAEDALSYGMKQLGRARFRIMYYPKPRKTSKPIQIKANLDNALSELAKALKANPAIEVEVKPTKKPEVTKTPIKLKPTAPVPPNVGIDPNRKGKQISEELYLACGDAEQFAKAAKGGNDSKLYYLYKVYERANKHIFGGRLTRPNVYLMKMQKTHNFRGRGIWKPSRRELGISPRLFIAGESHVLNTFIHEMCHQAVTDIDRVNDRTEGGHGPNWVAWMRKAGIPPARYDMTDATEYMDDHEKALKEKRDAAKQNAFDGKKQIYSFGKGTIGQFYSARDMKWVKGVVAGFTATKCHFVDDPYSSRWITLPNKGAGWIYQLDDKKEEEKFKGPQWDRAIQLVNESNQIRSDRRASRRNARRGLWGALGF